MMDFNATSSNKDIPNERVIELGTNNKIILRRKDPYGFWFVSYERGPVPAVLGGAYTTYTEAEKDVARYLEKQGKAIKSAN